MNSNFKKLNKNQLKMTVELDQQDLQKYINKAQDILSNNLELKGFRKGKVPKDLLKKHLDQGKVKALAFEIAMEESLADAIKSNSFDVLETSKLLVEKNDLERLIYSVVLDLFPEVKVVNLSKIKVKRQDFKIEEKEVDAAIEVIKNSRASFVNKGDEETAKEGDRVEVDFEVRKEDQIVEGGISKNHPLIIGGQSFIPGFEDQLIGMKKGESKFFSLVAPKPYFYKDIAGKKLDFSVKLNDIKKVIGPEVSNDFARSLGRFADLSELKENVKEELMQEKTAKESQKLRLEILDGIIGHSKIEVPDGLLDKQLDIMVSDFDRTLHEKGLELSLYLARIGKTQEELRENWIKDAEKQVKMFLVLRKLAKDFHIEASQEEVEEAVGQAIQSSVTRGEIAQTDIDLAKIKEDITSRILNEKTLEYIESRCAV